MIVPDVTKAASFLEAILQLPATRDLEKADLLQKPFLLEESNALTMYFAPHNEVVNEAASVVIVGITPGWTQMQTAFQAMLHALAEGETLQKSLIASKQAARFSGAMRQNLVQMLDEIEVPQMLGLDTSEDLFGAKASLLHTTSLVKYPVFHNGSNYTGHAPKMKRDQMLSHYAYHVFPKELEAMEERFLLIPLGKAVAEVLADLVQTGVIASEQCLFGFPHPSGANGHRLQQLQQEKAHLQSIVRTFFK